MKRVLTFLMSILMLFSFFSIPVDNEMTFADSYNGASLENSEKVSIAFAYKEDSEIKIDGGLPNYCDRSTRTNSCANVAGAIVLGYYDKTYDDLIENFSSARVIRDKVLYAAQNVVVDDVIARLYITMKTNITEGGTTITNFKNGLQEYVNDQGLGISYSQVISNYSLNYSKYEDSIKQENPVVLFCSKYSLVSQMAFTAESGTEEFTLQHYIGNHVLIGYGIRAIKYYNSSGDLVRQLTLLTVGTGMSYGALGYVLLDDYGKLIDGYKINIF